MLLKPGVDISRLNRNIRRFLTKADAIFTVYGEELVITSTYGDVHDASSLHYANDAVDLRLPGKYQTEIYRDLNAINPSKYDVILERDHIHAEYDPKI